MVVIILPWITVFRKFHPWVSPPTKMIIGMLNVFIAEKESFYHDTAGHSLGIFFVDPAAVTPSLKSYTLWAHNSEVNVRIVCKYTTKVSVVILPSNFFLFHVVELNFPCYWPFVRGIHRSPVNSPHKGQWSGALMFSLIYVWINGWVNNREAVDLRRHRAHYDVSVTQDITVSRSHSLTAFTI